MRNYRKRAYYDPMSDSTTPMSQSELAAEAEAVFDIVFDEDPNALLQSGAYRKIFKHFERYGISNDYGDAVSMANYIEKNLLRHSRRANLKRVRASVRWESSGMGYVSENYTVHNMGGEVYGEPDQWVILENDYDVPEISGVFDTAEDAMNAVEQKTSHRARRSRRVAYYDDYPDPLINQGPTYPDYSHPDLNVWDYGTRDEVLSIIRDTPEVENAIKDVLRSGGNPRDVKNIFEDHFGWEGVAYDMLGQDWLSIADRYR